MSDTPTPSPAQRIATVFGWIIASVRRGLATNAAGLEGPVQTALYNLIGQRLRTARDRLVRLAERVAAGWVYQPKPHAPRKQTAQPEARPKREANPLTTGSHWAIRAAPGPDSGSANNSLYLLLEEPQIAAVLAAAPGPAWRILRPICRMLGVDKPRALAQLDPPKRQPRPRPGKTLPVSPHQPLYRLPAPEWGYEPAVPRYYWPRVPIKPRTA